MALATPRSWVRFPGKARADKNVKTVTWMQCKSLWIKASAKCINVNVTNSSFIMGFIVFVSSRRDMASQYGKGRNISVSHLRYSANHNTLDSWPIRARLASQIDELCKNRRISATIMYSMWKIMCFLNLKPHKNIELHQIHKIMFFLATSYDPFNDLVSFHAQASYWAFAISRRDLFHKNLYY